MTRPAPQTPAKVQLGHHPTPLWYSPALNALVGCELWVKRDDCNSGAAAGNKLRKLEYLLAQALEERATWVITCGGEQSNHARTTALLARELGLSSLLLLRASAPPSQARGNHFLDELAGAKIRWVTPNQYRDRNQLMAEETRQLAAEGQRGFVIVEGGSSGLGALGYRDAVLELAAQLDQGPPLGARYPAPPRYFDALVCAAGSGGTAAGLALGLAHRPIAERVLAFAVCDDAAYFEAEHTRILKEARHWGEHGAGPVEFNDSAVGPGYGQNSKAQAEFLREVARTSGLVLDPVYSGKALYGLSQLQQKPKRVLFIHSGGLPGLLAQCSPLSKLWGARHEA